MLLSNPIKKRLIITSNRKDLNKVLTFPEPLNDENKFAWSTDNIEFSRKEL